MPITSLYDQILKKVLFLRRWAKKSSSVISRIRKNQKEMLKMEATTKFYNEGNIIWVDLEGFASLEITNQKVADLKATLGPHIANQTIVIDSTNLAVFKQEILPVLAECYEIYSKFGRCIMVEAKKTIVNIQLHNTAKKVEGFTGQFVKTTEEAKAILGI